MDILSYLDNKTLDPKGLNIENSLRIKGAKDALVENKESFFKVILETDKNKQALLGQFHTTQDVVRIVLDSLPKVFIKDVLEGAKVLDPSCGVGNFFIEIVNMCLEELALKKENSPYDYINKFVIPNILGFEIDSALASSAKVLFDFEFDGKINCPEIISFDSLLSDKASIYFGKFDYVVGNPPWVEVKTLPDQVKVEIQNKFKLSNMYGAFIIQGSKFLKKEGRLSFVVPRSFTGGKYFSSLRKFLLKDVAIEKLSYFYKRNQKFHGGAVLQELVIISFNNLAPLNSQMVECNPCTSIEDFYKNNSFLLLQSEIFSRHDDIMVLPESKKKFKFLKKIFELNNFEEHGFRFSTGQIVVHRAVDFLRSAKEKDSFRLFYAHDIINSAGEYSFRVKPSDDKKPYLALVGLKNLDGRKKDSKIDSSEVSLSSSLNEFQEIIIFRRRSHKGDKRRFVGIYLSSELPQKYFLDNSLNFICAPELNPHAPSLDAFYKILRSDVFEEFFSAISSNTQINKNDMYLFGLPDINEKNAKLYKELESINDFNNVEKINSIVNKIYEI